MNTESQLCSFLSTAVSQDAALAAAASSDAERNALAEGSTPTEDRIDWKKHVMQYHNGSFDPRTEKCAVWERMKKEAEEREFRSPEDSDGDGMHDDYGTHESSANAADAAEYMEMVMAENDDGDDASDDDDSGWFNPIGELVRRFPQQAVEECTTGDHKAADAVNAWMEELGFEKGFPTDKARTYLVNYGAWEPSEIEKMDDHAVAQKVFSLLCHQAKSGEKYLKIGA